MDLTLDELLTLRRALAIALDVSEQRALTYLPKSDATFEQNQDRAKWRGYHKAMARDAHALLQRTHAEIVRLDAPHTHDGEVAP